MKRMLSIIYMYRKHFIASSFIILLSFISVSAFASVPKQINFQGRLLNKSTGIPITGQQQMTFYIYNAESGGSSLWNETNKTITLDAQGVYSTILGTDTPLNIDFSIPLWLAITYGGETLVPRQKLAAVPYSMYAITAESLSSSASGSYVLKAGDTMTGLLEITPKIKVVGSAEIGDLNASATGKYSVAIGEGAIASGNWSTAIGYQTQATASKTTAFGNLSIASWSGATAMGNLTVASGLNSTAMGDHTTAGGAVSTAIGSNIEVDGNNSLGIGLDTTPRNFATDNTMAVMGGNVGIGTMNPKAVLHVVGNTTLEGKLNVVGTIETSGNGGIKFPDGSIQTTKAGDTSNLVSKAGDTMTGTLTIGANAIINPSNSVPVALILNSPASPVQDYTGLSLKIPSTQTMFTATAGYFNMNGITTEIGYQNKASLLQYGLGANDSLTQAYLSYSTSGGVHYAGHFVGKVSVTGTIESNAGASPVKIKGGILVVPGSAPTAAEGTMYYDSTAKVMKYYDGSVWQSLAPVTTQAPIFSPDIANTTGSITCTGGVYFHGILVKNGSASTNWGTVTLGTMSFVITLPPNDSIFVPLPYPYYVASGSIAYSSNTANLNVQVLYTK